MIKNTLGNNVRYLEFSIFSREQNNDAELFQMVINVVIGN